jgi:hypothetical protein
MLNHNRAQQGNARHHRLNARGLALCASGGASTVIPRTERPMNTRKLYRLALLAAIAFLPGCLVFTCGG